MPLENIKKKKSFYHYFELFTEQNMTNMKSFNGLSMTQSTHKNTAKYCLIITIVQFPENRDIYFVNIADPD